MQTQRSDGGNAGAFRFSEPANCNLLADFQPRNTDCNQYPIMLADGNLRHLLPIHHFTATAKTHTFSSVFAALKRPRQGSNLRQPA